MTPPTPPLPTKKLFTLVLIHDRPNSRVLLGRKKRGIGQGNFNGFGGKVEKDKDRDVVSSALRELVRKRRRERRRETRDDDALSLSLSHTHKQTQREEAGVAPDARGLSRRGVLSFHFLDAPSEVWETHLYSGEGLLAETAPPRETDEMEPRWFSVDEVPYEQMWQDDKFWLPAVLGCERKNVLGEFWVRRFFFF